MSVQHARQMCWTDGALLVHAMYIWLYELFRAIYVQCDFRTCNKLNSSSSTAQAVFYLLRVTGAMLKSAAAVRATPATVLGGIDFIRLLSKQ